VAAAVAVYLVSMWAMSCQVTKVGRRIGWAWGLALAWLAAVVLAVAAGWPLAWATPLLALAPALVVAVVEHARRRQPQLFDIH
jgi:hypothetical protein